MSNIYSLAEARARRGESPVSPATPVPPAGMGSGPLPFAPKGLVRQPFNEDAFVDEFNFRFDDVERYTRGVPMPEDPIVLGSQARSQIREMFWRYGLRRMPSTWGELTGNLYYCYLLATWVKRFDSGQPAPLRKRAVDRHNSQKPGRGTMLEHLSQGDLDAVWRWHEEQQMFRMNSQNRQFVQA